MNSEAGQWDASLVDLFRSEVETHSESLSAALLALERAPTDMSRIDEMMRAAHSIKGASRVVGVDPAVRVAHVMEDCFVAVQQGSLSLCPADVDVLLRGVDLLGKISAATRDPHVKLAVEFRESVQTMVDELQAVLHRPGTPGPHAPVTPAPVKGPSPAASAGTSALKDVEPDAALASSGVTISFPAILDAAAADAIRQQFLSAVNSGCQPIRCDLRATTDLDVQGLALLAAMPRHLGDQHRPLLQLAGISREMAAVFRVTGLAEAYHHSGDRARGAE